MNLLQPEHMLALAHAHQQELLHEANKARLADAAQAQQPGIWQRLFPRRVKQDAAFRPEAAPNLARPA